MHHYMQRLLRSLGSLEAAEKGDRAAVEASMTLDKWQVVCGLANTWSYCGAEWKWVADLASEAKQRLQAARPQKEEKPEPAWKKEPATEKQIAALKRLGYPYDTTGMTKGDASRLLFKGRKAMDRAAALSRAGGEADGVEAELLFEEARQVRERLGWDYLVS